MRILSLGAGVQSSTLLLMSLTGELEPIDATIFADTGWEPEAVYAHLDYLESECQKAGVPLYRVTAGNLRDKSVQSIEEGTRIASLPAHILNEEGNHALLKRPCTTDFKIDPVDRKIRELLGVGKHKRVPKAIRVQMVMGISLDEIQRIKVNRNKWAVNVYPLIDRRMTRHDCLRWLEKRGCPIPPKSACIGCPFHDNRYWRDMRDNRPEEWESAVEFDDLIRTGLRGVDCNAYLHRTLIPLREVDLSTPEDHGQQTFDDMGFANECEGMCGV